MTIQAYSVTKRCGRRGPALAAAAGVILGLGASSPASAAPINAAPGTALPVNTYVGCQTFNSILRIQTTSGRVVTLTNTDGEEVGKALVRRYSYIQRGGPQSGQTFTTIYPGPDRNLIECSVLAGPAFYTLSVITRS